MLAIECDGATYHSGLWARERDRLRQEILENMAFNTAALSSAPVRLKPSIRVTATDISSADKLPFWCSSIFIAARISKGDSMSAR